jgi:16S rRNA (cytidine1402-2'-O)-methyltransferase
VSPIPGPSALTAALSVAGLPTDRFCFEGFLPAKQKARRDRLASLTGETRTMVFYESVHRMADCIRDMIDTFGEQRLACIGRELSKLHEQVRLASLGQLREQLGDKVITSKGEFVIIVAGGEGAGESSLEVDALLSELAGKLPDKEVAKLVSKVTGERKNDLYQRLLEIAALRSQ